MNPSNSEMQLPPPVAEMPAASPENAPIVERAAGAERASSLAQAAPAAVPMPMPVIPQATVPTPQATPTTSTSTPVADDGDLIEKEWVNKAKQIVERTSDDPYKQSEELTLVKVDYLKKRYGKTLKLK